MIYIILLIILILIFAIYLYIKKKSDISFSSYIVNKIIYSLKLPKKTIRLVENLDETINTMKKYNSKKVKNPYSKKFDNFYEYYIEDMQVMKWNENHQKQDTIIYFHGGGYFFQPFRRQYVSINKIAKNTNSKVFMPVYPKAPDNNFIDAMNILEKFYRDVLKNIDNDTKISFIGDSAGGGLALGFAYYIIDKNLRQPDNLILISPWLDLTNSHPNIKEYAKKEAFFSLDVLDIVADYWANGKENLKNPYASPKYGDLSKIKSHISLFTGTYETFAPDVFDMINELKSLNKNFDFEIKEKLLHVYPFHPAYEGNVALKKIGNILNR